MKPISKLAGIVILLAIFVALPFDSAAQSKDKSKGGPPSWAPAHGYRAKTRQVYFPDNNFYYDVQRGVYIYLSGKNWQVSAKLPSSFANIDLKASKQIELELNTDTPQQYNAEHIEKYHGKQPAKGKDKKNGSKGSGKSHSEGHSHGKSK